MGRLLFFIFLAVPLVEIGLFILIGETIGLWPTLLGVVVTAVIGSAIIRLQGLSLIEEIQRLMAAGALPARQIADGVMLAIAGALLLTPGYFTDACGFLLLVPPFREVVYVFLKNRISLVATSSTHTQYGGEGRPRQPDPEVVDLEDDSWRKK